VPSLSVALLLFPLGRIIAFFSSQVGLTRQTHSVSDFIECENLEVATEAARTRDLNLGRVLWRRWCHRLAHVQMTAHPQLGHQALRQLMLVQMVSHLLLAHQALQQILPSVYWALPSQRLTSSGLLRWDVQHPLWLDPQVLHSHLRLSLLGFWHVRHCVLQM
jgi:hypothetical protein